MRPGAVRGQDGFTLTEVLIATSIFMLIIAGVFQIFEPSNKTLAVSQTRLDHQQNARVSMDLMTRQIRMTGYFPENIDTNTANDKTNPVQLATESALAVYGDLDNTGTSNVFLFCRTSSGLTVVKGAQGVLSSYQCSGGSIVAESISAVAFVYYDTNNNPLPNPLTSTYNLDTIPVGSLPTFTDTTQRAAIRRVVIRLTATDYTLTSDVRFRNP